VSTGSGGKLVETVRAQIDSLSQMWEIILEEVAPLGSHFRGRKWCNDQARQGTALWDVQPWACRKNESGRCGADELQQMAWLNESGSVYEGQRQDVSAEMLLEVARHAVNKQMHGTEGKRYVRM